MPASEMTAAYVTELGPAENIRIGTVPVPRPGPTDVLVAVESVVVNPVDTFVRSGRYQTPVPLPFVIGRDLVGTVSEAVPHTGLRPGDRVWCNSLGHEGRQGSFAEFAVVPAERLYRLPDGVDPRLAVAVAHPAATAYLGWFRHARLEPGDTVFVGGGAGNVGTAAIQLAACAGARVIASARPDDHAQCRSAGAEEILDYRDPRLGEKLHELAPAGIDIFWETSGHHDVNLLADTLRPGGTALVTAATDGETPVPFPRLYTHDIALRGFVISRATASDLAEAARLINRLLPTGRLTATIAEHLPLSEAAAAHRRIEDGTVRGRLLLSP